MKIGRERQRRLLRADQRFQRAVFRIERKLREIDGRELQRDALPTID